MDITELLSFSVKNGASDLHLSAGLPPMIRVDGDIRRINVPVLDHKAVHSLIYDIMNDKQRRDYEEFLEPFPPRYCLWRNWAPPSFLKKLLESRAVWF
jgi:twitching motility protein PilT